MDFVCELCGQVPPNGCLDGGCCARCAEEKLKAPHLVLALLKAQAEIERLDRQWWRGHKVLTESEATKVDFPYPPEEKDWPEWLGKHPGFDTPDWPESNRKQTDTPPD
jgi:hypothetical protein